MAPQFLRKFLALGITTLLIGGQAGIALAADTTPPSDVEGLEAFPGDSEVTLTWDAATDDTGVAGYYVYSGLTSVSEDGGSYTFGATDTGDVLEFTMDSLTNGVTYYFTLTAYDVEGNESEFYSFEVEGTPEAAEVGDFTAPTVTSADAITSTLVEVQFSEDVVLPEDAAGAFSLEASDGTFIEVVDAYLSEDDSSVVFVVTEEQIAGAEYILTSGITIEDLAENPIVSGTSDTAIFTGSALDEAPVEEDDEEVVEDAESFEIESVESNSTKELVLDFNSDILVADADSFMIQSADDATVEIQIITVGFDDNDASKLTLTTEEMEAGFEYVLSIDEGVLSTGGDELGSASRSVEFTAKTLDLADVIAPEDITNLLSKALNDHTVQLNWTSSIDTAGDLANYLVYRSGDGGISFGSALEIAKDLTSVNVDGLTPGSTYTFKVTARDENGNESEGVLTTVTLPDTGPGMLALGGFSLLGAGLARRRKRQ